VSGRLSDFPAAQSAAAGRAVQCRLKRRGFVHQIHLGGIRRVAARTTPAPPAYSVAKGLNETRLFPVNRNPGNNIRIGGSPIDIPEPDEHPLIGWWSADEIAAAAAVMDKLDLSAETDPEAAQTLGIVKKWLQQAGGPRRPRAGDRGVPRMTTTCRAARASSRMSRLSLSYPARGRVYLIDESLTKTSPFIGEAARR
jgi:hypothetical protein